MFVRRRFKQTCSLEERLAQESARLREEAQGLPAGTERDSLIRSHWEAQSVADAGLRPPRKYYKLTRSGKATLEASRKRYPLLVKLIPSPEEENA